MRPVEENAIFPNFTKNIADDDRDWPFVAELQKNTELFGISLAYSVTRFRYFMDSLVSVGPKVPVSVYLGRK